MREPAFPWHLLSEPAFAAHATSAFPAWLWSLDGRRLLWANPGGAAIFGAATCAASGRDFDTGDAAPAQIAMIAPGLPVNGAPSLQRLRGFGASFGGALTCVCRRIAYDDAPAILIVAAEQAGPRLSLTDRVRRLFEGYGEPVSVYSASGELLFGPPGTDTPDPRPLPVSDPASHVKLGEGEHEVRIVRRQPVESERRTTGDAKSAKDIAAELIDLSPIAEAISEAQKAMAVERAAHEGTATHAASPNDFVAEDAGPATDNATSAPERRHPMRFVWTIDADNRFSIEPGDFIDAIGPRMAGELNRPWISIAADLDLDPEGEVARAIASRDTWSGITIDWPVDDSNELIAVELAGLPVYDRNRNYRGYRGFGVCRDLARISALLTARQQQHMGSAENVAGNIDAEPADQIDIEQIDLEQIDIAPVVIEPETEADVVETRPALSLVPASENVVPFRPLSNDNTRTTTLNAVEENAFQELATRLTAQLKSADDIAGEDTQSADEDASRIEPAEATELQTGIVEPESTRLAPVETQPREHVNARQERPLLDLLPIGILIYRQDQFLYANRAFLRWSGADSVQDFAEAGGLDTFVIAPQADDREQTLCITPRDENTPAMTGHLFSIPWADSTAMMLVTMDRDRAGEPAQPVSATSGADELKALLDIATDGVVTFGRDGNILTANAGAERMLGYDAGQLMGLPFTNLFAAESAPLVRNVLQNVSARDPARNRDVTARTRRGETLPLLMTVGRIDESSDTFCAAFQNLSRWKATERELIASRKQAEAASSAKSDFLAKVSHEIRTPLNAIIGFSDVMMSERFGPIGTERYKEYLKDIHTSGTHLVALVNDLLDLSKIEAGKLDLSPEPVNLNDLTQQTVALLQPEASRERIIIRTSLAPELPPVMADARSVRQIVLNLLSNSIKFTGAGGQVILSTARTDHGEAVLRVRDTGVGMSEKDIATALEPFRQLGTASRPDSHGSGLGLPLTKALVEANSARFSIKSAVNAGTLVEIVFPAVRAAE